MSKTRQPLKVSAHFDGMAVARGLPETPGVYRFLDAKRIPLYVGKARNLKKRVSSYFHSSRIHGPKIKSMLGQTEDVDTTVTHTEDEALILENNLIKELRPRYNVVLRDDKSYPYIYLSRDHSFPRLSFHRGARTGNGRYFGPYPSAGAVRGTLSLLQKLFLIRNCEDSFFQNRSRPCLQYQIKRCTAPCVGLIDEKAYKEDIDHAVMFLQGRNQEVIELLIDRMEESSRGLDFERAAHYRDQINRLRRVQQKQYISTQTGDVDIIACVTRNGVGCVQVFFIRNGHNLGNKAFFPDHTRDADAADILSAFVPQYYLAEHADRHLPSEILINEAISGLPLLMDVLSRKKRRKVRIRYNVRGDRTHWLKMAVENADMSLKRRLSMTSSYHRRVEALRRTLDLDEAITRIECFDISHTQGEATVASCVVFGAEGPIKSDYRRYNIEDVEPGDDYAAMRQAISRRYTRVQREEGKMPDMLLIDGGAGQVKQADDIMRSLQITELCIVGVAKGPSRKPGLETLKLSGGAEGPRLDPDSTALHLIQQIRDEAHRFAITGHRQRRAKPRNTSVLQRITGIGVKRRRRLIHHFGGLQGIARAGIEDLTQVSGISAQLAAKIYQAFHGGQ